MRGREPERVATDDQRLMRVIIIQEALAGLTLEEAAFVLETVQRNMDLNDQLRRIAERGDE
jgi:hypothetical protein